MAVPTKLTLIVDLFFYQKRTGEECMHRMYERTGEKRENVSCSSLTPVLQSNLVFIGRNFAGTWRHFINIVRGTRERGAKQTLILFPWFR